MKHWIFIVSVFFLCVSPALSSDDFQYWNLTSIKPLDTKYVDYVSVWDMRFGDNASELAFWMSSHKLNFDVFEHVGFVTAYSYLESQTVRNSSIPGEFKYQHRLELEANPRWKMGERLRINNRNRVEFRWIEDQGSDHARFRHKWEFFFPLKNVRALDGVYASNELFYLFNRRQINENWVVPIGFRVKLYDRTYLDVYYMIRSLRGSADWQSQQVIGTHFSIAF